MKDKKYFIARKISSGHFKKKNMYLMLGVGFFGKCEGYTHCAQATQHWFID